MNEDQVVVDASVVLAVLLADPKADQLTLYLSGGVISAANFSEIVAKLQDRGMADEAIGRALDHLDLQVIAFDERQAVAAGKLRGATRKLGLSLGDRACLALAAARGVPAVTVDRGWDKLDVGIKVVVAR